MEKSGDQQSELWRPLMLMHKLLKLWAVCHCHPYSHDAWVAKTLEFSSFLQHYRCQVCLSWNNNIWFYFGGGIFCLYLTDLVESWQAGGEIDGVWDTTKIACFLHSAHKELYKKCKITLSEIHWSLLILGGKNVRSHSSCVLALNTSNGYISNISSNTLS